MTTPNQIELETVDTTHHLLMGEALNRLRKNEDFKHVITNGYLGDKVMASFSLLAVPQEKASGNRPNIFEDMIAASNLLYFFKMVDDFYKGCIDPILSDEEEAEIAAQNAVDSE